MPNPMLDAIYKVGSIATSAIVTIDASRRLYKWAFPSEKEKERERLEAEDVHNRLVYSRAEKALYKCLRMYEKSEKNSRGIPCECEEAGMNFAEIAGYGILNRKIQEFREGCPT